MPMTEEAIKLARDLFTIAAHEKSRSETAKHESSRQLHILDAKTCEDAAAMLQKLDTEVFRLREAIGCFMYGRLERHELRQIAETWNGDPAHIPRGTNAGVRP